MMDDSRGNFEEINEEKFNEQAQKEKTKTQPEKNEVVPESALTKQYNSIKIKNPDALILFRVGNFYEALGKDAEQISEILGIILTKTKKGKSLTGFNANKLDSYLSKLIKTGSKVALVEHF